MNFAKTILDSCTMTSNVSSGRLMQWTGILFVLIAFALENVVALVMQTIQFSQALIIAAKPVAVGVVVAKPVWTFSLIDLVTVSSLVGGLIVGVTAQKFSKNDVVISDKSPTV